MERQPLPETGKERTFFGPRFRRRLVELENPLRFGISVCIESPQVGASTLRPGQELAAQPIHSLLSKARSTVANRTTPFIDLTCVGEGTLSHRILPGFEPGGVRTWAACRFRSVCASAWRIGVFKILKPPDLERLVFRLDSRYQTRELGVPAQAFEVRIEPEKRPAREAGLDASFEPGHRFDGSS